MSWSIRKSWLVCWLVLFATDFTFAAEKADRLSTELGQGVIGLLRAPQQVLAGKLKTRAVLQAERAALTTDKCVAGYPVLGKLNTLSADEAPRAGKLIADPGNHRFDVERRCLNTSWVGFRFLAGKDIVEVALGKPCDQVVVVWRIADKSGSWGGILRDETAAELRRIAASVRRPSMGVTTDP